MNIRGSVLLLMTAWSATMVQLDLINLPNETTQNKCLEELAIFLECLLHWHVSVNTTQCQKVQQDRCRLVVSTSRVVAVMAFEESAAVG